MSFWEFVERNLMTEGFAIYSILILIVVATIIATIVEKCG